MRTFLAVAFLVVLTTIVTPATASAATTTGTGNFCNTSLSTGKRACFTTMSELLEYRSAAADYDLVAVYNWISYDQRGGYDVWSGDHVCTGPYDNNDYVVNDLSAYSYVNASVLQNNTYSSVSTYVSNDSKCDIRLYDGFNRTGDSSVFIDHCTHLATCTAENWYDRASSFVLS